MPANQPAASELWVVQLGRTDYDTALSLQERVRRARQAQAIPDVLLLLSHDPVYTCGRRSEPSELPLGAQWYAEHGIQLRQVNRGGKVTYHGPGQLVAYPILDTAIVEHDIVRLVGMLEATIIAALAAEGVAATRDPAGRGVWAGPAKIGSIGLHVAQGVTTHGLAVNVDCDLQPFSWIKPCGLDDPATSIAEQTGQSGRLRCFSKRIAFELTTQLGLRQRLVTPQRLALALEHAEQSAKANDLMFSA